MKFSIIIPTYNAEQHLTKCLQSIINQTHKDFEAIIVNDGSTDSTESIAKSFVQNDSRFKYIVHENHGVSFTRNRGIKIANNEYIVFLDSDDQYCSNYLEEFAKAIKKFPNAGNYWCRFESIHIDSTNFVVNKTDNVAITIHNRSDIFKLRNLVLDSQLWNKVFRKSILEKHSIIMDEKLSLGEDTIFNYEYLDKVDTTIVLIDTPLYLYSVGNNESLDNKFRPDLKEIFDLIDKKTFDFLSSWNIDKENFQQFYNSVFFKQERLLRNTMSAKNPMSNSEKIKYNNSILRSKKFNDAFNQSKHLVHPLYRLAYNCKSWRIVSFFDFLFKIKRTFSK